MFTDIYFILFYFIYLVKLLPLFDATSYGEIKIVIMLSVSFTVSQHLDSVPIAVIHIVSYYCPSFSFSIMPCRVVSTSH